MRLQAPATDSPARQPARPTRVPAKRRHTLHSARHLFLILVVLGAVGAAALLTYRAAIGH